MIHSDSQENAHPKYVIHVALVSLESYAFWPFQSVSFIEPANVEDI